MRPSLLLPALLLAAVVPCAAHAQDASSIEAPASIPVRVPALTPVSILVDEDIASNRAGSAIRYKVRENGVELCKLQSGTYCKIEVPAGKHEYVVHSEAKDVLTLEVEPGETYYVIGGITVGVFAGHPNLSPSDKATFEAMLPKLKDFTGQDLDPPGPDDKKN